MKLYNIVMSEELSFWNSSGNECRKIRPYFVIVTQIA